jgi:hypothetical protein
VPSILLVILLGLASQTKIFGEAPSNSKSEIKITNISLQTRGLNVFASVRKYMRLLIAEQILLGSKASHLTKPLPFRLFLRLNIGLIQGVTKRCLLSWLPNGNAGAKGEGGCGVSSNEHSCAHGAQINFGDLTSIFNLWFAKKNFLYWPPSHAHLSVCDDWGGGGDYKLVRLHSSVLDPDPPDPHVFGPPGSGSISMR